MEFGFYIDMAQNLTLMILAFAIIKLSKRVK